MASPAVALAGEPPAQSQVVASDSAPRAATQLVVQSDDESFAKRETQAKSLEKFEGGQEVVVVTSATTVLVVLIILLILL